MIRIALLLALTLGPPLLTYAVLRRDPPEGRRFAATCFVGAMVLVWSLPVLWSAWMLTGRGGWSDPLVLVAMLVWLCCLFALPFAVVRHLRHRDRARVVAACCGVLAGLAPGALAASGLRMHAFELAAGRAAPLVAAILAHERDHGAPPPDLAAFAMPAGLPPLELVTGEAATRVYHGNTWALASNVGTLFAFDTFYFVPAGNYPERGLGGVIQRVGAWAYVHE